MNLMHFDTHFVACVSVTCDVHIGDHLIVAKFQHC